MHSVKTRYLVYCAIFLALAVLFSFFSIYLGPTLKVSLAPAIIIYSGIVLGPLAGAFVGAASDLLVLLVKPIPGPFFPGYTLTLAIYGVLGGLMYRTRSGKQPGPWQIIGATAVIQFICSGLMNTQWTAFLTGTPFSAMLPVRLPLTAAAYALYTVLLIVLVRYKDRIISVPIRKSRRVH